MSLKGGLVVCLAAILVSQALLATSTKGSRYEFIQERVGSDRLILRLIDWQSERLLWTRSVREVARVAWSQDENTLAVLILTGERRPSALYPRFRLVTWRAGERVREHARLRLLKSEGFLQLEWSPNGSRLLVRSAPSFGNLDQDVGVLWCFDLRSGREERIAGGVTRAVWLGARRIRYWQWTGREVPDPENPGLYRFEEVMKEHRCR